VLFAVHFVYSISAVLVDAVSEGLCAQACTDARMLQRFGCVYGILKAILADVKLGRRRRSLSNQFLGVWRRIPRADMVVSENYGGEGAR